MQTEQLVAVHRNHFGDIISFRTSEGRIISYRKALQEAEAGTIEGLDITANHNGENALHSFNDLPTFY